MLGPKHWALPQVLQPCRSSSEKCCWGHKSPAGDNHLPCGCWSNQMPSGWTSRWSSPTLRRVGFHSCVVLEACGLQELHLWLDLFMWRSQNAQRPFTAAHRQQVRSTCRRSQLLHTKKCLKQESFFATYCGKQTRGNYISVFIEWQKTFREMLQSHRVKSLWD